jgi:ADP-ribose pyrophosphatase YjhB (NUDIX family)
MIALVKPIKHAISVIIQDAAGKTLFALRSPSKREYPNVWSLPSHFMKEGETAQDTVRRVGAHKLGVTLEPMELLNEGRVERPDFTLFMHDYSAKITKGTLVLIQTTTFNCSGQNHINSSIPWK